MKRTEKQYGVRDYGARPEPKRRKKTDLTITLPTLSNGTFAAMPGQLLMNGIFKQLGYHSLWNLLLVCKEWNLIG